MSAVQDLKDSSHHIPQHFTALYPGADNIETVKSTCAMPAQTQKTSTASIGDPIPTPSRPLTRSQTGTIAKRRTRDDADDLGETKLRLPASRKRHKATSTTKTPQPESSSPTPERPRMPERSVSVSTSSTPFASTVNEITFCSNSYGQIDPRLRANLPTPVPNLTKKSRGRHVPTSGSNLPDEKNYREYECNVCFKCFRRGEHLKRHIRSIHTHEKPFQCTYPLCRKYFNRRDNLLQHYKVHKEANDESPVEEPAVKIKNSPSRQQTWSSRSSSRSLSPRRSYSSPPSDDSDTESLRSQRRISINNYARSYDNVYSAPIMYTSSSEPVRRITNMAVSSLRTELSPPPPDSRSTNWDSKRHDFTSLKYSLKPSQHPDSIYHSKNLSFDNKR